MGLDIRLPIGLMFSLIGLMLTVNGFLTRANTAMYARSLDININLVWGLVLFLFGAGMLAAARLGRRNLTQEKENRPQDKPLSQDVHQRTPIRKEP